MNLLPLLYAFLAALTGISSGVAAEEPRIAAVAQAERAATAVAAILSEPRVRAFEPLRDPPRAASPQVLPVALFAPLPLDERPASRRE